MSVKIMAVTGSRADWGLLSPALTALKNDSDFNVVVAITGQHLVPDSGDTIAPIAKDGFETGIRIDMELTSQDDAAAITKALAKATTGFADILHEHKPDFLMVLGDRYEILGAVQAALLAKIPVAHLCGGDITEGALDDLIRHALTKMSHLHFVTNAESGEVVVQMGENPAHVYNVGSPGLDHIKTIETLSKNDFFAAISFKPREHNLLVTFHPATLEENSQDQCKVMLSSLQSLGDDYGFIFTGSNADPEGASITRMVSDFAAKYKNATFISSLGTKLYFNALIHCDAMIGNSSSGLYEAPSFGLPAINIGNRQKGRIRAKSVIDVSADSFEIVRAIKKAMTMSREGIESPYGDGNSGARIVEILKKIKDPQSLLKKPFFKIRN